MRMFKHLTVAALGVGALGTGAPAADAQIIYRQESAPRGWLGISYQSERPAAGERPIVRITDVVDQSPAERAGLRAGDAVLSVNGIAASDQLISSLAFSLAPGESVNLRIRRGDAEHDVTIVTAERPAGVAARGSGAVYTINTDSVRGLARVWLDSARTHLENIRLPEVIFEGARVRVGGDTIHFNSPGAFGPGFVRVDTIGPGQVRIIMRGDTLLRAEMDSVVRRLGTVNFMNRDSAFTWVRAAPGFDGMSFFSIRSIAGAELVRLEPGMDSYFGTADGVLVVRVGDDTPAARAGMRAGDVIVGVNAEPVRSVDDVRRLVGAAPRDRPVRIELLRERRSTVVELPRE